MALGRIGARGGFGSLGAVGGARTADYFVDPTTGSDSNPGSQALPFATYAKSLSVVGSTAGKIIAGKKGTVARESGLNFGANNTSLIAYGSGANPQILGSTQVASSWSLVSGTEYQTALAYTPRTAFWVAGSSVTKLRPGTSGSLSANQYAISGGNLHVNIGINPTGQDIEIAGNNSNVGLTAQNLSGISISGITIQFMPFSGLLFNNTPASQVLNSVVSWNGDDGIDITASAAVLTVMGSTIQGNGFQARGAGGGPGDGISAHLNSTLFAYSNIIIDNDQTGLGNENDTTVIAAYNYLRNNFSNIFVYNSGTSTVGMHDWHYNIIVASAADNVNVSVNGPADSSSLLTIVTMNNNTIHSENASLAPLATFAAGTSTLRNNIFNGGTFGISNFNGLGGNVAAVDVDFNLYGAESTNYQPSFGPGTIGANEVSAATSGFTSLTVGAENFQLLTTSAAKASGTNLNYTRDQIGNPVPFIANSPCRGALEREAS